MRKCLLLSAFALALVAHTTSGENSAPPQPKSSGEMITIKLIIAEIPEEREEQEKVEPLDLTKPGDQVLARVEALAKHGRARLVQRVELTTLDGYPAQIVLGETVPALSGFAAGLRGHVPLHTMTDVGTIVSVTPRLAADNFISLDLLVNSSRLQQPTVPAKDEDLKNFRPAGTTNSRVQITVRVPAGTPTVLTKFERTGQPDAFKHVAVVTATRAPEQAKGD